MCLSAIVEGLGDKSVNAKRHFIWILKFHAWNIIKQIESVGLWIQLSL